MTSTATKMSSLSDFVSARSPPTRRRAREGRRLAADESLPSSSAIANWSPRVGLKPIPAQIALIGRLDALAARLDGYSPARAPNAFERLIGARPAEPPRGLYIFGPVGRGKTLLMDLFFDAAPASAKRRVHFHAFMADVHARLHQWRARRKAGEAPGDDPIAPVAAALAAQAWLLCFDEFSVRDIADAMILGRLFDAAFDRRRRGRRDLERRARRSLQGRPQPHSVPAVHRLAARAARDFRARRAHRFQAGEAGPRAGFLQSRRRGRESGARRRLSGA